MIIIMFWTKTGVAQIPFRTPGDYFPYRLKI